MAVIREAYVHGVSTRPVDDLVKAMGAGGMSKSQVIPTCADHDPWAHSRIPMDMIFHGRSVRLFQASQQSATMSS